MPDQPLIDAPGVYLRRDGGYGHVVSVRGAEAIGWIVQKGVSGFGHGAWSIADGCETYEYSITDGLDIIGPVTEPVPPPGKRFVTHPELPGRWFVENGSGLGASGLELHRERPSTNSLWAVFDSDRDKFSGYKPLHVALGDLWNAVMEGK